MKRIFDRLGLGLVLLLFVGAANAQDASSLEQTYAALCGTQAVQQGETCVALRKAITDKTNATMAGAAASVPQLDPAIWGVYADLVGKKMAVGNADNPVFGMVEYSFANGRLVEKWTWYGSSANGSSDEIVIEYLADRRQLRLTNSAGKKWPGTVRTDGAVVFSKGSIAGKSEMGYYPTANGLEHRTYYLGKDTVEHLAPFDVSKEAGYQQIAADNREQERREKREAADARAQMFGAIVNGVAQGYVASQAQNATQIQSAATVPVQPQSPAPRLIVGDSASTPVAIASTSSSAKRKFGWCVAIQPGAYMDAPGAMFLSEIDEVDWSGYQASEAAGAFGEAVAARYGAHPGSVSCNSWGSRTEAETRWREQHDIAGLSAYKKVATGMPAAH